MVMVAMLACLAARQCDKVALDAALHGGSSLAEAKTCAPNPQHTEQLYLRAFNSNRQAVRQAWPVSQTTRQTNSRQ